MVEHYIRHENILTVTMILTDPIYWEEPFIRSATFELDANTRVLPEPCEPQVEIPRAAGEVPHYLPGANPYLTEFPNVQPADGSRARRRHDVSGIRQGAALHLQAARQVHGVCCGGTGQATQNDNKASCRLEDLSGTWGQVENKSTQRPKKIRNLKLG